MAVGMVLLSIPQLRRRDVTPGGLASLDRLVGRGGIAELVPPFPGLAAPAFATLMTGVGPAEHGLIGNVFYDRMTNRVEAGPFPDSVLQAPRLWDRLREIRPGARSLLWFAPNARDADVEFDAWAEADWSIHTGPPGLAEDLIGRFGPFPCPTESCGARAGEPPRLEATGWVLRTAGAVIDAERPDLAVVRVPYLGQVARRFGPDGREAGRAVRELESVLGPFLKGLPAGTEVVAVTESVVTPVSGPIYPNRILRELGLLRLAPLPGGGETIDTAGSAAFALADHQLCHVYINDPTQAAGVASSFSGACSDGIAAVAPGDRRAALGMEHPRAGDVVLVACPDRWFAPDWWTNPAEAPRRPAEAGGLTGPAVSTPLDPAHVKGSLGAPPPGPEYLGVVVASRPELLAGSGRLAARDLAGLVLRALGA